MNPGRLLVLSNARESIPGRRLQTPFLSRAADSKPHCTLGR